VFDQVLGIPWGYTGLGFGGRAHSPNEFCTVKGMKEYEKSVATIFCKFKDLSKDK
jgi:di/tripeptidase